MNQPTSSLKDTCNSQYSGMSDHLTKLLHGEPLVEDHMIQLDKRYNKQHLFLVKNEPINKLALNFMKFMLTTRKKGKKNVPNLVNY